MFGAFASFSLVTPDLLENAVSMYMMIFAFVMRNFFNLIVDGAQMDTLFWLRF